LKNLGGTFNSPDAKIVGHVGMDKRAYAGVIDYNVGASIATMNILTSEDWDSCFTTEDLRNLMPPDATVPGSQLANKTGKNKFKDDFSVAALVTVVGETGGGKTCSRIKAANEKKKKQGKDHTLFASFKPALFLQELIIQSGIINPFELIIAVREEMKIFEHVDLLVKDNINHHVERHEVWSMGAGTKLIPATTIELNPFDKGAIKNSEWYHDKCSRRLDVDTQKKCWVSIFIYLLLFLLLTQA
jgi:hypothetical protein